MPFKAAMGFSVERKTVAVFFCTFFSRDAALFSDAKKDPLSACDT